MDIAYAGIDIFLHRRMMPIIASILLSTACGARTGLDTLGASLGGTNSYGGASAHPECLGPDAGPKRLDGSLVRIGNTDPTKSLKLEVGGYFTYGEFKGYCFTYADGTTNGSTIFPPCGGNGAECFTKDSGLCATASLGVASGSVWGAGIGCSLSEDQFTGESPVSISLVGKTSISVEIFGCITPKQLRLQLNINPPIYEVDIDRLHSGYYCADVNLSDPDLNGARHGTVEIGKLSEDCWNGPGLLLDTATQTAKSVQLQISADGSKRTDWDFCVSKLSLD